MDRYSLGQSVSQDQLAHVSNQLIESMQEAEKKMHKSPLAAPKINNTHIFQQRRNKSLNAKYAIKNNLKYNLNLGTESTLTVMISRKLNLAL